MRMIVLGIVGLLLMLVTACGPFAAAEPTATAVPPTTAPTSTVQAIVPTVAATRPAGVTAAPAASTAPTSAATAAPASSDPVRIGVVATGTEARYRVREQLVGVSLPSDAVGKTKAVTGMVVARPDGTIIADQSKITVNLSTLQSDENRRDNFLRTSVLQTSRFPNATFVPKEAKGLALPIKDGAVSFQLTGDLTIRDVTKPVTWDVKGNVKGNEATGQATTSFTFAYFNMQKPQVPVVLSVEDTIKLEIDLQMQRQ